MPNVTELSIEPTKAYTKQTSNDTITIPLQKQYEIITADSLNLTTSALVTALNDLYENKQDDLTTGATVTGHFQANPNFPSNNQSAGFGLDLESNDKALIMAGGKHDGCTSVEMPSKIIINGPKYIQNKNSVNDNIYKNYDIALQTGYAVGSKTDATKGQKTIVISAGDVYGLYFNKYETNGTKTELKNYPIHYGTNLTGNVVADYSIVANSTTKTTTYTCPKITFDEFGHATSISNQTISVSNNITSVAKAGALDLAGAVGNDGKPVYFNASGVPVVCGKAFVNGLSTNISATDSTQTLTNILYTDGTSSTIKIHYADRANGLYSLTAQSFYTVGNQTTPTYFVAGHPVEGNEYVAKTGGTFTGAVAISGMLTVSGNLATRGNASITTLSNSTSVNAVSLTIGNNIGSGTASNASGGLVMYGSGTTYAKIAPGNPTTSYQVTMPNPQNSNCLLAIGNKAGVGSVSKPIYMADTGVLTACGDIEAKIIPNFVGFNVWGDASSGNTITLPAGGTWRVFFFTNHRDNDFNFEDVNGGQTLPALQNGKIRMFAVRIK